MGIDKRKFERRKTYIIKTNRQGMEVLLDEAYCKPFKSAIIIEQLNYDNGYRVLRINCTRKRFIRLLNKLNDNVDISASLDLTTVK